MIGPLIQYVNYHRPMYIKIQVAVSIFFLSQWQCWGDITWHRQMVANERRARLESHVVHFSRELAHSTRSATRGNHTVVTDGALQHATFIKQSLYHTVLRNMQHLSNNRYIIQYSATCSNHTVVTDSALQHLLHSLYFMYTTLQHPAINIQS